MGTLLASSPGVLEAYKSPNYGTAVADSASNYAFVAPFHAGSPTSGGVTMAVSATDANYAVIVYISYDGGKTVASTYSFTLSGVAAAGVQLHIVQAHNGLFVLHT